MSDLQQFERDKLIEAKIYLETSHKALYQALWRIEGQGVLSDEYQEELHKIQAWLMHIERDVHAKVYSQAQQANENEAKED